MQDYVTPLPLIALVSAHTACFALVIANLAWRAQDYPGWRMMGPGGTHWFTLYAGWAFGALISWVWLFVGSARADAEFQMRMALLLALVFTSSAVVVGAYVIFLRRRAIRWRGKVIAWRQSGRDLSQPFEAIASAHPTMFNGAVELRFADDTVLKIDMNATNVTEFLACLPKRVSRDFS